MNGKQGREKRGSQQKQPEVLRFFAVAFEELWYLVKLNVLLKRYVKGRKARDADDEILIFFGMLHGA